ncbi:unnamed protein product [Rotaria magnacalcarata]|uniref:Uncharacterized protein n=1 Tax=Rotaria magnacalcarata TaxID=392030 RepID=A0A819PFP1_9BILA|nr:unnamed protein product [Rotaria magnacalcarata]CAF2116422.1 unnamed protein product [Rotaria magnacalcarata]CAF4016363.1 unnamed protein product [Rotaria magnacalcarata]
MFDEDYSWASRVFAIAGVTSIAALVILAIGLPFPVAMLWIGSRFHHPMYCPVEPRISLFLIVGGSSSLTWLLLTIIISSLTLVVKGSRSYLLVCFIVLMSSMIVLLQVFNFIWLIIGSVWTFSVKNQVQYTYQYESNFCQKLLYQFTYVYLIIIWILFGLQSCCQFCNIILPKRQ